MDFKPGFAAMIAAALTFLVAGCGGSDEKTASSPPAASTPTATQTADADAGGGEDADAGEDKDKDAGEEAGGADRSCSDVGDLDRKPKRKVPGDVFFPDGAHVYESQGPFGKTTRYFAVTEGGPDDLPKIRDDAATILTNNGYKLNAKDQEEGAEAEAHLSGNHNIDVQVINLCKGKLRIRYTVS
jgi:hypothetical protein